MGGYFDDTECPASTEGEGMFTPVASTPGEGMFSDACVAGASVGEGFFTTVAADPGMGFFASDCEPGSCYDRGSFFIDLCAETQCQIDCRPYSCNALFTEYQLVVYPEGTNVATWDFLDYYDTPTMIPALFRKGWSVNEGLNWQMTCSTSGQSWGGRDSRISATNLNQTPGIDLDLCDEWDNGGLIAACTNSRATNKGDHAWGFAAPGIQPWGATMANCNLSFVNKYMGFGQGSSNHSCRVWEGYNEWNVYGETNATVAGQTVSIWTARNSTTNPTKHYIVFNYTRGEAEYYAELPYGEFNQDLATLWQVGVSYSNVTYEGTSYQDYYKASYDVHIDIHYHWTLTRIDGFRVSGTHTKTGVRIMQIFDHTKGSAVPGADDIDEFYKPKSRGTRTNNSYFAGSMGAVYNIACAHRTDALVGVNITGNSPGTTSSAPLETAFTRNQINYTLPPECPA